MLRGETLAELQSSALAPVAIFVVVMLFAVMRFRKRLD
jgi:hypothetical protein